MTKDTPVRVGDWVRFRRDGILVIGIVEYITRPSWNREIILQTDISDVDLTSILEIRSAPQAQEQP